MTGIAEKELQQRKQDSTQSCIVRRAIFVWLGQRQWHWTLASFLYRRSRLGQNQLERGTGQNAATTLNA